MKWHAGFTVFVASILLGGCAHKLDLDYMKEVSAGRTGCLPDDNVIANVHETSLKNGTTTWTASCKEKTYVCSNSEEATGMLISCTPLAK
jgi:hypothetical protein